MADPNISWSFKELSQIINHGMSEANFNHRINLLRSRVTNSRTHLLSLPYDIRRLIYDFYYPVAKGIQLMSGPVTDNAGRRKIFGGFKSYRVPSDGIRLLRVCRQINEEATALIYGINTFFLVPNDTLTLQPCRIASLWLYHLRKSTKQIIKKLYIHIELPLTRPYIAGLLISGVCDFPALNVSIVNSFWLTRTEHAKQRRETIQILEGIRKARALLRTHWTAFGALEVLHAMLEVGIIIRRETMWKLFRPPELWWNLSSGDCPRNLSRRRQQGEILMLAPPTNHGD